MLRSSTQTATARIMASVGIETLQLEILELLFTLPADDLKNVCDFLGIAGANFECVAGKSRPSLITMISNHLQREELEELEDMGMSELLFAKDKITEFHAEVTMSEHLADPQAKSNEDDNEQDETQITMPQESKLPQLRPLPSMVSAQRVSAHRAHVTTVGHTVPVSGTGPGQTPPLWHKEFKISGQIGEPGQKDRLTFSSLARQIEHGLLKGFPETEIVDAVIRAIVPGMQLRSYLEGKSDLKLPTLRRILRCHYQEKSATELYKQLSSEVQGIKETPQTFLIRALDLRQKILFASQESESGLRYDPVLVQNMFLHSVLTGLQNDNVKRDLQPYLELPTVSDELLFEKLNTACACESERQVKRKMTISQRPVAVHTAQSDHMPAEKKDKTSTPGHSKNQVDILLELQEMRTNMSLLKDLKAEVASIKESMQQPSYPPTHQPSFPPRQHPDPVLPPDCTPHQPAPVRYGPPQRNWSAPDPAAQHSYRPFNQRFANQYPPRISASRRRRCYVCEQENVEDCIHCFRCGSNEHFAAGCRMSRSGQSRGGALNGPGLPQRGRE